MNDIVTLISWGLIIIFALLQFFLALRPVFIWGLVMPALFGFLWLYFGSGPGVIPILDLPLNQTAMDFYAYAGQLGLLVGMAIFCCCRLGLLAKRRAKRKKREQRLAAKQERELRARMMAESYPDYAAGQAESPGRHSANH